MTVEADKQKGADLHNVATLGTGGVDGSPTTQEP